MAAVAVYLKILIALYVLINPFEGLPIFLARTQTLSYRERVAIGQTAAISVVCIMLVALLIGRTVLELFSISIGDFATVGGIIIFLIGLKMVLGPSSSAESFGLLILLCQSP